MELVRRRYIDEILSDLHYKDSRSAIGWCNRNGLDVFKDGVRSFVIEAEFINAYNSQVIPNIEHDMDLSKSNTLMRKYSPRSKTAIKLERMLLK